MKVLYPFLGVLVCSAINAQQFNHQLPIPPLVSGTTFNLTINDTVHQFNPGVNTNTFAFNGTILGPTLEMQKWDTIQMNVTNHLNEVTTVHWHGLHVPAKEDGGPHTVVPVDSTWSPSFRMLNNASTCWYHPHTHMETMRQVNMGLAGMIIIRDSAEAQLNLPRNYGVDDFPVVIQDRSLDGNGQFLFYALADSVIVNGATRPYMDAPAQMVRMRILNGANARAFIIAFSDNRPFYVIASDGGLISAPDTVTSLKITNGERYEIIVDFTNDNPGDSLYMICKGSQFAAAEPGGSGMQSGNSALNGVDYNIMQINVVAQTSSPVTTLPQTLIPVTPWQQSMASVTRTKNMMGMGMYDMGNMTINGLTFDMNVVNDTIYKNAIEIWNVSNNSPQVSHPFHIHDVQFYILDRNGLPPQPYESGLKDVIYLKAGETVSFITKFENFTDSVTPYMYHCHNLHHEDMGMMLQFIVIEDPNVSTEEISMQHSGISAMPNPSQENWVINSEGFTADAQWMLTDINGKTIETGSVNGRTQISVCANPLQAGVYFFTIFDGEKSSRIQLIRN
jgi:FtsP/CotA-like multicopper oxidase with cupredoxin domain